MPVKIVIDGAKVRQLMSRDGELGRYMLRRAQVVQEAARVQCPKRTGKLSESIVKRFTEESGRLGVTIIAAQPYAFWVHEGTKAHVILPRRAKALRWFVDGQPVFARRVNHPGTKPNKFLSDNLYRFFE